MPGSGDDQCNELPTQPDTLRLIWVVAFVQAFQFKSFSLAAHYWVGSITPSSLGRHVKHLESWLGAKLFEDGTPLTATEAGRRFFPKAVKAIELLEKDSMRHELWAIAQLTGVDLERLGKDPEYREQQGLELNEE